MSRPQNRYARAQARARYRKPKRRGGSMGWNIAIGVIVLLGVAGVIYSVAGSDDADASPGIGDHWHAQLAVFVCGQDIGAVPPFDGRAGNENVGAGLHSHGDTYIHIHPTTSDEAGNNATIGTFFEFAGYDISEDRMELWDGTPHANGDACAEGQPGEVRWTVNGEEQDGNPADYKPENGEVIVLAFVPAGQEIPAAPADPAQPTDV